VCNCCVAVIAITVDGFPVCGSTVGDVTVSFVTVDGDTVSGFTSVNRLSWVASSPLFNLVEV